MKIEESKEIIFSEYVFSENNVPALINSTISYVEKLNENEYTFYFKFDNFKDIIFMSNKNHFDKELINLEIRVLFNVKDFINNKIIYKY